MKIPIYLYIIIILVSCKSQDKNFTYSGTFEGTEPFWRLELKESNYELDIQNKSLTGEFLFSHKANRGETFSFKDKEIFGFINRSTNNYCEYAITDEDSLSFEIFLQFDNVSYKGCGKLKK